MTDPAVRSPVFTAQRKRPMNPIGHWAERARRARAALESGGSTRMAGQDTPDKDNTLRMDGLELGRLNDELDSAANGPGAAKRSFRRWPFRHTSVRMDVQQHGGAITKLKYACRNISANGMSLVHSAYLHVGSSCTVHLPMRGGGLRAFEGKVVRCRHCKGRIHEIGVQFAKCIDLKDLLDLDPFEGRFAVESVDPQRLVGKLLHVEDSAMDRRLLRHHLQETQMSVITAETAGAGIERAREGFDIIVTDYDLPDMKGVDLVNVLRNEGIDCPIIVVSAEGGANARESSREARASAFIQKPFGKDLLLRGIADLLFSPERLLKADKAAEPELPSTNSLAAECIAELRTLASTLRGLTSNGPGDPLAVAACIKEIRSAAKSLGFTTIIAAADAATAAGPADAAKAFQQLAGACMRVRETDLRVAA